MGTTRGSEERETEEVFPQLSVMNVALQQCRWVADDVSSGRWGQEVISAVRSDIKIKVAPKLISLSKNVSNTAGDAGIGVGKYAGQCSVRN